ncbi:MAG: hypothetical protein BAA04_07630 [Firmicutes bacterium ZCTH02-B6]|nr:MAG: hypothetical protein BAA04_07630 [Firmicutes bacterium ZCTH02-B6]
MDVRTRGSVLYLFLCATLAGLAVLGAALAPVYGQAAEGLRPAVTVSAESVNQPTVRIKDIARFDGVRDNQLYGMGLVIGLEGTGDGRGSQASVQMVANMLERFGITVDRDALRLRNVAAVMVTADLPAFVRPGDRIDVTVSSIGDARSLQGGFLLQTPLQAADGQVYAVAQGPVSIGGFNVRSGGSQTQRNHAAVGTIPGGAIVERFVPTTVVQDGNYLTLLLTQPDFTTAARVADVINQVFTPITAQAVDRSAIRLQIPPAFAGRVVEFIAAVEELPVTPDAVAKVVINERTGTIVMGHRARVATVAIAHGSLRVRVETQPLVALPGEESSEAVVVEQTTVAVEEERARTVVLESGASVEDVVNALNAIGATPRDIIAILQAMKAAGALYAQLEIL